MDIYKIMIKILYFDFYPTFMKSHFILSLKKKKLPFERENKKKYERRELYEFLIGRRII